MLKNYFLIAVRAYGKQKGYTAINILGLSVGLACAIFIFLYINNELNYDSIFPKADRTYRLASIFTPNDGDVNYNTWTPGGWNEKLKADLPEVTASFKYIWAGMPNSIHYKPTDKILLTEELVWVQNNIHEVMHFPIIKGNRERALEHPTNIVISEEAAAELFGKEDPIGKPITLKHPWMTSDQEVELTVTGIFEDYPQNTHFKPKYIVNYYTLRENWQGDNSFDEMENQMMNQWWFYSYIVTDEPIKSNKVKKALDQIVTDQLEANPQMAEQMTGTLELVYKNVQETHFDQNFTWENEGSGNMKYIYTFASIAFLIIMIACINYMNLATARSAKRAREVGVRKAMGSQRLQLFGQFMTESVVMIGISFALAMGLVAIFLPTFNQIAEKEIGFAELFNPFLIASLSIFFFVVAFLSGSYPALFLSGFHPVKVLKGKFAFSRGSNALRKILISVQFGISLILLVTTLVVVDQMELMHQSKLNQAGEQILSIRHGGSASFDRYQTFRELVQAHPDLESITFGNHLPRLDYFGPLSVPYRLPDLHDEELRTNTLHVDFNFSQTFGLELVAGRFFDEANLTDSMNVIINEAACKTLSKTPEEMLGASITTPTMLGYGDFDQERMRSGQVIGVVKDFPYQSAYQTIDPLVLYPQQHVIDRIVYVKLPKGKFQESIAKIEKAWKQVYPEVGFDYWFVNDEFDRMYVTERRIATLSRNFSGLAIFITCIGLFGLASFVSEQKTKEIGVRKVLGAKSIQILSSLLLFFLKILLVTSVIALPLAYYLSYQWLQDFTLKTPIGAIVFLVSLGSIVLLTVATVSYESLKASLANPVKSLRYE